MVFCDLKVDSPCEGSLSLKETYTAHLTHTPRHTGGHVETPSRFRSSGRITILPGVTLGNGAPRGKAGELGGKSEKYSTEELSQKEKKRCFIALIHLESPLLKGSTTPPCCFSNILLFHWLGGGCRACYSQGGFP